MDKAKKKRLEAAGWSVGDAEDFLQLTVAESAFVEIKTALALSLSKRRKHLSLSQTELAKKIHSSQSRVAKMEAGDPSVSLDLLVRSLLSLGLSKKDLARTFAAKP